MATLGARLAAFWNHEAGPKTIHFWAPTFKWGLVIAGLSDLRKPPERVSTAQNTALALTGVVWSRYATQIKPVNYNLLAVNIFVAATGGYQLYRKFSATSNAEPEKSAETA